MNKVIAVLTSDLHLSHKSPIARSAEKSWYDAMKRSLDELRSVSEKYDVPIICTGDIFDRWNSPPELINFAIDNLPKMYAIPGQHDLPNHRLDEIEKSAYWTLVKSGIIINLTGKNSEYKFIGSTDFVKKAKSPLCVYAFPWGIDIEPLPIGMGGAIHLAVIHSYIWTTGHSYPGADKNQRVGKYYKQLEGYDVAVFGDNHQGFIIDAEYGTKVALNKTGQLTPHVMNCGTLRRRKIDEIDYKPQIGLLHSDGSITPHFMDTSKDKFIDVDEARVKEKQELDISKFLQELKDLGSDSLDFRDAANRYMDSQKTDDDVRSMVLDAIE